MKTIDVSQVPAVLKITNNTEETVGIELIPFGTQEIEAEGSISLNLEDSELLLVNLLKAQELGLGTEITPVKPSPEPEPPTPPAVEVKVDTTISAEEDLFGKVISDLQENVSFGNNKVTGTLKYVADYTGFSSKEELQSGNYIALHATTTGEDPITVEVVNGISGPVRLDADGIIVLRIADKETQSIRVVSGDVTKTFALTDLVLEAAPVVEEPEEEPGE